MAWALNSGRPWDTEILRLTEHVPWPGCGLPTMAQPDRFALSQTAHLDGPEAACCAVSQRPSPTGF